jgi:hypothetical protein
MARRSSSNYAFVSALLADKGRRKSIESLPCKIFEADGDFGFRFAFVDKPGGCSFRVLLSRSCRVGIEARHSSDAGCGC